MVPARKTPAYRRLKLEQLVTKIQQIEQQAVLTLHEYPNGHTVERQRLIMAIARQVRSHLLDQLEAGERQPLTDLASEKKRMRAVEAEEQAEKLVTPT